MPATSPQPLVYSKEEAAAVCRVSQRTINAWVRERGFPHRKIGSRILFPVSEVGAWLEKQDTVDGHRKAVS